MNARSLPDPDGVLPNPDEELPRLRRMMFDWFETGIIVGIVPEGADRRDPKASSWRQRVHALRTTGRLPAENYGREWRWSAVTLRKFVGLDDGAVGVAEGVVSGAFEVRKTVVDSMPGCEVHPTVEPADGCLSISWTPIGTSAGHVYCCWSCAEGGLGRFVHALDESAPGTQPVVELQVLRHVPAVAA